MHMFKKRNQYQVTGPVILPLTVRTVAARIKPFVACVKPLSLLFSFCPAYLVKPCFLCVSGEAAVPERNPSSPPRSCMALSVRRESEERAEPRKVSGLSGVSFTSSLLLPLCCI